jgi:hypothetical protein
MINNIYFKNNFCLFNFSNILLIYYYYAFELANAPVTESELRIIKKYIIGIRMGN